MAITKTATRDLTTAIAGKIWEAIKDADNNSLDNQASVDPEVRKAKRDLDKSDPDATSVEDKPLRESLSNMFGKLDVKLIQIDSNVNTLSGKVSSVGGAIADTQKLIINQNEMLMEKFDQLFKVLGIDIDAEKKAREDLRYEQLALNLAEGDDLSTTSGYAKARRKGGSNILLTLLGRRLGRMFGRAGMKFLGKLWKKGIFKRPRVLSKLLRRHVSRKLVRPTVQALSDTAISRGGRRIGKNLLMRAMKSPIVREALIKKLGKEGLEKLTLKLAGKAVPVAQTAYGAVEGLTRGIMGDWKGMMLSFGSAIPYAGYAFTAVDLLRDIDQAAYTKHIEGNFPPSEKNIADFFQDALDINPSQYETGTAIRPQSLGIGGVMSSIAPIVSVVRSFGEQSGEGQVESLISQAGLGNVPTVDVSHSFSVGRGVRGATSIDPASMVGKAPEIMNKKKERPEEGDEDDNTQEGSEVSNEGDSTNFFGANQTRAGFRNQNWDFWDWIPDDWFPNTGEGGSVQPTETIMGGAVVTQRNDPDAEQTGVDIALKNPETGGFDVGAPIMNPFEELTITDSGFQGSGEGETGRGYGKWVTGHALVDGKKYELLVAHLDTISVNKGDVIQGGDIIGTQGITGRATGPHVSTHINALDGGNPQDILNRVENSWVNGGEISTDSLNRTKENHDSLKPTDTISSLNSVKSPVSNIVSEGSMDRHVNNKQARNRSNIVILNNQVIKTSNLTVPIGSSSESGDFFPAYNLARLG